MKKFELSIPKPCHENWDAMTPAEKGRFCGSCQKTVIDFSNMSDREMAQFFKKPAGDVCGRFYNDQLDRPIEIPTKRIPWLKYFFTISLPAFLLSLKVNAQKQIVGKVAMVKEYQLIDTAKSPKENLQAKLPLKGRVAVKKPVRLRVEEVRNDSSLFPKAPVCVQPTIKLIEERSSTYSRQWLLGGLVYVNPVSTKSNELTKLMPVKSSDVVFLNFSIYPNPAIPNALLTIRANQIEGGSYQLQVIASSGDVVQTEMVLIGKKTASTSFQLNTLPAGAYFVQLTNKKNKKFYTEIIIVQ